METENIQIRNVVAKGYSIVSRSSTLTADELKVIREQGLPTGDGWLPYSGLRFIRGFVVSQTKAAIAWVEVLNQADEFGRSPIFASDISVVSRNAYREKLEALASETSYTKDTISTVSKRAIGEMVKKSKRAVLTSPFVNGAEWQKVNHIVIRTLLALNDNSYELSQLSFTTFALNLAQEKSLILVLPTTKIYLFRKAIHIHTSG